MTVSGQPTIPRTFACGATGSPSVRQMFAAVARRVNQTNPNTTKNETPSGHSEMIFRMTKAFIALGWLTVLILLQIKNLIWVSNVDRPEAPSLSFEECWPGSAYVDVLSFDCYHEFIIGGVSDQQHGRAEIGRQAGL